MELDGLPTTVMPPSAVTLIFDLLTPKFNKNIYELRYICDQNWVKLEIPFFTFLRYGVHEIFRTHRLTHSLTHSLTDGQIRMQNASVTVFQR